jgi:hypothetical protein
VNLNRFGLIRQDTPLYGIALSSPSRAVIKKAEDRNRRETCRLLLNSKADVNARNAEYATRLLFLLLCSGIPFADLS